MPNEDVNTPTATNEPTTTNEPVTTREREVIITNNGTPAASSGVGPVVVAVVGLLIALVLGFVALQIFTGDDGIDIPDTLNIDVNDGDAPAAPAEEAPAPDDAG